MKARTGVMSLGDLTKMPTAQPCRNRKIDQQSDHPTTWRRSGTTAQKVIMRPRLPRGMAETRRSFNDPTGWLVTADRYR